MEIGSLWTYLLARLYQNRINDLVLKLCSCKEDTTMATTIYLESPLYPSRIQTNRYAKPDLSVGCLKINKGSKRQLKSNGEWICVAEIKWLDELIQPDTWKHQKNSDLPHINQFAKLIEHALLLQDKYGNFPERVYVNLITPRYFKDNGHNFKEKIYKDIYYKYKNDKDELLKDLKKCSIDFKNPNHNDDILEKRVNNLTLNWITFEELLGLNDLVSNDNQKNEPKTNRDSWRQVFNEMNRTDLIKELLS
jgi:hypothetical protein